MIVTTLDLRLDYDVQTPTHARLLVQAMRDEGQRVDAEQIVVKQSDGVQPNLRGHTDALGNRFLRFDVQPGGLHVHYLAQVTREAPQPPAPGDGATREHLVSELPDELMPLLLPSSYCDVHALAPQAWQWFGALPPGLPRVEAIVAWIRTHIRYEVGSSGASTTAAQALAQRAGVCRDFAHLAITFCRGLNIPARFVVGYTLFDEAPQDFHAVFEVWLGRWIGFDPTGEVDPARLVRVGLGTDAKDVAFATFFGRTTLRGMTIDIHDADTATGLKRHGDASSRVL